MMTDFKLTSNDTLTELTRSNGVNSWNELTEFTRRLPYGRNNNRSDFGLVLTEGKGTCSSKHAFLKKIANLNNIPNIKLVVGIYKMNHINTPKIGNELIDNSIEFIPEAHCYLKVNDKRVDYTTEKSELKKIELDILQEKEITPEQVTDFKVDYHKEFIKDWLKNDNSELTFDEVWKIREKCIENLTD